MVIKRFAFLISHLQFVATFEVVVSRPKTLITQMTIQWYVDELLLDHVRRNFSSKFQAATPKIALCIAMLAMCGFWLAQLVRVEELMGY